MTAQASPTISVVVMGYRNRATIVAAVRSLVEQRSREPFEVVVVVSGDDGSAEAVRAEFPEVSTIAVARRLLPGGARNRGVERARGEIVAFLAADCVAAPGWITARIDAHRAGHAAVASAVTAADPQTVFARAHTFDLYCSRLPGRPAGFLHDGDAGAHGLSFDRGVLDRAGPFPDDLRIGEDTVMTRRLHSLGVPIWFEPRIVTGHRGPRTLRDLVADRYGRGVDSAKAAGAGPHSLSQALRAFPRAWRNRLQWVVRHGWRHTGKERSRFVCALPWIVVGHTAGAIGQVRGRVGRPSAPRPSGPA